MRHDLEKSEFWGGIESLLTPNGESKQRETGTLIPLLELLLSLWVSLVSCKGLNIAEIY